MLPGFDKQLLGSTKRTTTTTTAVWTRQAEDTELHNTWDPFHFVSVEGEITTSDRVVLSGSRPLWDWLWSVTGSEEHNDMVEGLSAVEVLFLLQYLSCKQVFSYVFMINAWKRARIIEIQCWSRETDLILEVHSKHNGTLCNPVK